MQLSSQSQILTDIDTGPSGMSVVFKLISTGSLLMFPSISLKGMSILKSLILISTPQIPSASLASIPRFTTSLQIAPSWGNVITQ